MIFDNLKKMQELKKLQDSFKNERFTVEKKGVKVVIDGNLDVTEINLSPELDATEQADILKQCINEAKASMQKTLAKSLMGSGLGF